MIYVVATVYFWKISKHWFPYVLIGFVWQAISCVLLLLMPESPRWLVSSRRLDRARQAFGTIAKFNRCELEWNEDEFRKNVKTPRASAKRGLDISLTDFSCQELLEIGKFPDNVT